MDERVGSGLNSMILIHYPQLFAKTFLPNLENFLFSFPLILSIEALWGKLFHNIIRLFSSQTHFSQHKLVGGKCQ